MTATTMPHIKTEVPTCVLCQIDGRDTLGEIWLNDELVGRMVQCAQCGLRFLSPRPIEAQRNWLYAQEYGLDLRGANGEARFDSVHADQERGLVRFRRYLDQLEPTRTKTVGKEPRLLDIGAGTGQLLELARERGWAPYAIEQSEDACQHLRERLGTRAVVGRDLTDLHEAASYDAIVMAHVIEHLPDPLAALRGVRRLLAPGGRLVVATPNDVSLYERLWQARQRRRGQGLANPYVAIAWRDGQWYRTPTQQDPRGLVEFQILTTEHLFFFTRATLGRMLHRVGFNRVGWASGSVSSANSRFGRLLRNDPVNRALFLAGLQSELVAVAETGEAT